MKALLYDSTGEWVGRVEVPDTRAYPVPIIVVPDDPTQAERKFWPEQGGREAVGRFREGDGPGPLKVPESAVEK